MRFVRTKKRPRTRLSTQFWRQTYTKESLIKDTKSTEPRRLPWRTVNFTFTQFHINKPISNVLFSFSNVVASVVKRTDINPCDVMLQSTRKTFFRIEMDGQNKTNQTKMLKCWLSIVIKPFNYYNLILRKTLKANKHKCFCNAVTNRSMISN